MKYLLTLFGLLVCLSASAQTTRFILSPSAKVNYLKGQTTKFVYPLVPGPDITSGEIAALWFDNNLTDSSGNGNSATAIAFTAFTNGQNGGASHAYSFNGSSQYLTVGTAGSFANFNTASNFAFTFWMKPISLGTYCIFNNGNGYAVNGYFLQLQSNGSMAFFDSAGGGDLCTAGSITAGVWNFVVINYNGSAMTMYVNGSNPGNTGSVSSLTTPTTNPFAIGAFNAGSASEFFPGSIDDFRVWGRVLQSREIGQLYVNGAQGP
jgi:hypothetical protein